MCVCVVALERKNTGSLIKLAEQHESWVSLTERNLSQKVLLLGVLEALHNGINLLRILDVDSSLFHMLQNRLGIVQRCSANIDSVVPLFNPLLQHILHEANPDLLTKLDSFNLAATSCEPENKLRTPSQNNTWNALLYASLGEIQRNKPGWKLHRHSGDKKLQSPLLRPWMLWVELRSRQALHPFCYGGQTSFCAPMRAWCCLGVPSCIWPIWGCWRKSMSNAQLAVASSICRCKSGKTQAALETSHGQLLLHGHLLWLCQMLPS